MGTLSVGSLAMMNISGRAASSGGDNGSATSFVTLFQGDSITDGNRGRTQDPNHILGHGYASHVASTLGALHPERNLSFLNRGISGDTVASLQARWKSDALALRPDVISLLIGVNDILHRIKSGTTKSRRPTTQVRIVEIYADKQAYQSHLQTPHFQHYKSATLKMVKDLKLVDMTDVDKDAMLLIFEKLK